MRVFAVLAVCQLAYGLPQDPNASTTITPQANATSVSLPTSTTSIVPTSGNPCAQISSIYTNSTEYNPRISAQLAYECLQDVALDQTNDEVWLDTLRPYLEWQSTTAYLKDPPAGYLEPAIDVHAEFENIVTRLKNNNYKSEYDLDFDIYRLFQRTHDGHFRYIPSLVGGIFGFGRPLSLISYSEDGTAAPKPFVYQDVLSYFVNGTGKPSAIIQIDGKDAVEFLEDWAQYGSLQDPDALYNNVFYELAQVSLGTSGSGAGTFAGGGRGAYIYPGPTTTLTFENGTSTTMTNFARVLLPFRGINSGADLYKTYINPQAFYPSSATVGGQQGAAAASTPTPFPRPGYPVPVFNQHLNYVSGYYLNETGYTDVAVLAVTSFVGTDDYQDLVYDFLDQASKAGKKKLIIDVSANGGGTIMQGYNLFLNLFPDILPYGGSRFRSHEAFNIIGETASERVFYYPFDYKNPPNYVWQDFGGGTPFNYRADVDVDYKDFESWADKNPPNTFMGDNFTSIIRWNLSDPLIEPANNVQPNGFGNRTGLPPSRPFAPEDIIILYDGYCASTCAIFSEFMTQQAGVKTISIGGRPNDEKMQTVGGVKGTNNYPWTFIHELVTDTYTLAPDQAGFFNSTLLYHYIDPDTYAIPFNRATGNSGQVNVRDGLRQGDQDQTPLQFVYDGADCRLYYTAEMTIDVSAIWEKVADVAWDGDSCVVGGISSSAKKPRSKRDDFKASQKSRRRLQKRKAMMTNDKAAAIEQTLELFTDPESIVPMQGLMLP